MDTLGQDCRKEYKELFDKYNAEADKYNKSMCESMLRIKDPAVADYLMANSMFQYCISEIIRAEVKLTHATYDSLVRSLPRAHYKPDSTACGEGDPQVHVCTFSEATGWLIELPGILPPTRGMMLDIEPQYAARALVYDGMWRFYDFKDPKPGKRIPVPAMVMSTLQRTYIQELFKKFPGEKYFLQGPDSNFGAVVIMPEELFEAEMSEVPQIHVEMIVRV